MFLYALIIASISADFKPFYLFFCFFVDYAVLNMILYIQIHIIRELFMLDYNYSVTTDSASGEKAADILVSCLADRRARCRYSFTLQTDKTLGRDEYRIAIKACDIFLYASGVRGFIFASGHFLRKCEIINSELTLTEDISGSYTPYRAIRGHQLGYRTTPNTYDAWSLDDYEKYFKELMLFGCNTMEHTHFDEDGGYNALMKYTQDEFLTKASAVADSLDLDVSVWYPNDKTPEDEYFTSRERVFKMMSRIDAVFPPGGDPGCFDGDEFVRRSEKLGELLKSVHPNAKLFPSAQTPDMPGWGEKFISEMERKPSCIDGIVTGPNRAFDLDELRRRLPKEYPIRLYPDITHNVRCEYPVHVFRDDWHYAAASVMGRESVNPRPREYAALHKLTAMYTCGSVSYSEGVHDDVNKFIWTTLDYFGGGDVREILLDYARLFIYEASPEAVADGILALENNWECSPTENPGIEYAYTLFSHELDKSPTLKNNWRFMLLMFRAECDLYTRRRMLFDSSLTKKAYSLLANADSVRAKRILSSPLPDDCIKLRRSIEDNAGLLFELIGIQLDVKRYGADSWERGAVLESIDNPVTDRQYLLNRIAYAENTLSEDEQAEFYKALSHRSRVDNDEYYYSFALHGFDVLGVRQEPNFYMDFQGDRPDTNNGSIPMSMLKVFDHYSFLAKVGGLTADRDYKLILNIKPRYRDFVDNFRIKINGHTLYAGRQYGGERDTEWDERYSAPGFETHSYIIPHDYIVNGCVDIEIREEKIGIMLSEFRIIKA